MSDYPDYSNQFESLRNRLDNLSDEIRLLHRDVKENKGLHEKITEVKGYVIGAIVMGVVMVVSLGDLMHKNSDATSLLLAAFVGWIACVISSRIASQNKQDGLKMFTNVIITVFIVLAACGWIVTTAFWRWM